ncbi:MAG: pyruvate kinase [Hymenobacter sp.]
MLIREGVDVFRLNFSHGTHEEHLAVINTVRRLNKDLRTNVGLLQDLQGPKIRLGDVEGGGVEIKAGDKIKLVCGEKRNQHGYPPVHHLPGPGPRREARRPDSD